MKWVSAISDPGGPSSGTVHLVVRDRLGQRLAPVSGGERVGEVLGFVADLHTGELHDADRVGRRVVVGDDDLAHPQTAAAADPQHGEVAFGRMPTPLGLDPGPAAEALPGLWVVQ